MDYLYFVNSQVNYIIYAVLILFAVGSMSLAIQKIPFASTVEKSEEAFCGTENPASHSYSVVALRGKGLFMSHCASCHHLFKDQTGPSLLGFENRGPWSDRKNLYEWIRNPSAFMEKDSYAKSLIQKYGGLIMTAFPNLTDEEIDAIVTYIIEANIDKGGIE